MANTTFISLKLDLWRDNRCDILYFVVEYKQESADIWTTGEILLDSAKISSNMIF